MGLLQLETWDTPRSATALYQGTTSVVPLTLPTIRGL